MKLIIAGSRKQTDQALVFSLIEQYVATNPTPITEVVCGDAAGPDTFGRLWAESQTPPIPVKRMPAKWKQFGRRRAGKLRNIDMGKYADALLAIWDGKSGGTAHMIHYMRQKGAPVTVHICPLRPEAEEI